MEKQQEQEKTVLKPCPFCGSTANYTSGQSLQQNRNYWYIRCTNAVCSATGPLCSTEDEALKKWNTRFESKKSPIAVAPFVFQEIEEIVQEAAEDVSNDDGVNWRAFRNKDGLFDLQKLFDVFTDDMKFISHSSREYVHSWLRVINNIFPIRSRQVATLILAQALYMAGHGEVHKKLFST